MEKNAILLLHFPKDYFAEDIDSRKCLHATSSNVLFCRHCVGNMFYDKFSRDVSCRFNERNVIIMLEFILNVDVLQ